MPLPDAPPTVPPDVAWTALSRSLDPRALLAPAPASLVDRLEGLLWEVADPRLVELARLRISQLLGSGAIPGLGRTGEALVDPATTADLRQWPTSPHFTEDDRTVLGFVEQFVIDVAQVSAEQRASLGACLGPDTGSFVTALYLLDYGQRTQMAFERIFPGSWSEGRSGSGIAAVPGDGAPEDRAASQATLQQGVDELLKATARLSSLDMVTTEVVRLRGARQHNCRICQSTRSRQALAEGADERMFDKIDRYEGSDLSPRHKVALRLVDALITQPAGIDPALTSQLRELFTPAQAVELVYDVMRNSCQKVAVALAVDDPHVTEGVELYSLTDDGDVEFLGAQEVA